jgi:hypothetical protein
MSIRIVVRIIVQRVMSRFWCHTNTHKETSLDIYSGPHQAPTLALLYSAAHMVGTNHR